MFLHRIRRGDIAIGTKGGGKRATLSGVAQNVQAAAPENANESTVPFAARRGNFDASRRAVVVGRCGGPGPQTGSIQLRYYQNI
jgi:hypothetical protein